MNIPTDPITILVIGPSQNGKSTFINRLIRLAVNKETFQLEGDGNVACTTTCNIIELEIPLTEWYLYDLGKGQRHDVPDITDEEKIVGGSWFRKQTTAKYSVEPDDPRAPCIKLRLIDTPGLDDSEGRDFENMGDVLSTLHKLSKSPLEKPSDEWRRRVNAIALVYNSGSPFSHSFQGIIRDYFNCMPNLFGGLSVINTHFSVAALSSKRQHLLRDKIMGAGESARSRVLRARAEDFKAIFANKMAPTHFFIDNKPRDRLAYDEMLSRNTIFDILCFWAATAKPMPISQMRLVKNETMRAIDQTLAMYLQRAMNVWNQELRIARRHASRGQILRTTLLQEKKRLEDVISRVQSDLERYDNETEYSIQTYTTQDDPGVWALVGKWFIRSRVRNTMTIQHPDYPEFDVSAENTTRAQWISKSYDPSTSTWTGEYEGNPGKVPNLVARSFTTNRVHHRKTISELTVLLRRTKADLAENEDRWNDYLETCKDSEESEMDQKALLVETANNLSRILEQPTPPVDQAFDEASRLRYRKMSTRDVDMRDLFAFVQNVEPDFLEPLRAVLRANDI